MSRESSRQRFLIAVDPSLTCSGWALFSLADGAPLAAGTLEAGGPEHSMSDRLEELQKNISQLFNQLRMGNHDVLVCEGPAPLVLNPSSAIKVERVRSIFESVARGRGVVVPGRINPRTVQTEILGLRGKQLQRAVVKETARVTAQQLFGAQLSVLPLYGSGKTHRQLPQDVIDALLIGAVALSRVRLAEQSQRPLTEAFTSKSESRSLARSSRSLRWSEDDLLVAERIKR